MLPWQASIVTDPSSHSDSSRVLRRFLANKAGVGATVVLLLLSVVALVFFVFDVFNIPFPADPAETSLPDKLQPPSSQHPLGTDNLGRDVLSRLLHGSYISLSIGFLAVGISMTIGIMVGAIAGYVGGKTDNVLMRFVDALMCFPDFFLILTAVALLGPSLLNIVLVIALIGWTGTSRLVRAEFLTLRESEYVRAARALGQSHTRIVTRHILPNAMPPIFVAAVLSVPAVILTEAGLSFLGFGVQPPRATWGNIISDGKTYILDAWWLILFPGMAIFVTAVSFYLAGEALRDAIQTRAAKK